MEIDKLIEEMRAVKLAYDTLEIQDILRLFNIQALKDLTKQISRLANK